MTGPIVELDKLLSDVAKAVHGERARVADIYFENLLDDRGAKPAEFYNVYVIVQFPRVFLPELMSRVSVRLSSSRDSNLRRLGQALSKLTADSSISH
jgi:hypothetical protein